MGCSEEYRGSGCRQVRAQPSQLSFPEHDQGTGTRQITHSGPAVALGPGEGVVVVRGGVGRRVGAGHSVA